MKLVRTVELADTSHDEILGVLFPTMAFIEDQFHAKPGRVLFCGLGDVDVWEAELGIPSKSCNRGTERPISSMQAFTDTCNRCPPTGPGASAA